MSERPAARERSGVVHMVHAALWFAVMSTLVKLASERLPTMQIVFARGFVTLGLAAASLAHARKSPFGGRSGLLFLRGLIGSCALVCFYAAVVHLPLAEATVVHQTAPLWTALLAAWLLHERLRPRIVTALLGAMLSAIAYVTVRRLGRTEDPLVVVFWFPLVTVPMTAPFALPQWTWPTWQEWLLLLGIGASTQIAQVELTRGLAKEAAGRATAVGYLQVAFATLFGAVVFGDLPDAWSWAGMATIVVSLAAAGRRGA